ncbi:hypothetical protein [Flavobacterium sp. J27]|uniref:hypothetical protein n=1 Tax=Flavobacterium sp. J27 TaxID=2060419 RepID=UPI00102F3525|nr:hypothetical protein [Flavobacterium sp. J27]
MKNLYCYFVLILLFSISSCENNEDILEENIQNKTNFTIKKVKYNELIKNTIISEKINQIQGIKTKLETNKTIYNSIYDFFIATEEAVFIDDGISQSYTFPVYRLDQPVITENLVIYIDSQKTLTYLVDYGEDITTIKNKSKTELERNKVKHYLLDLDTSAMIGSKIVDPTLELVCIESYSWELVEYHEGDLTGGPLYEYGWVLQSSSCAWVSNGGGGGTSGSDGSTSGNDGSTGTTGGSGSLNGGDTVNTTPTSISDMNGGGSGVSLNQAFRDQLNEEQNECLNSLSLTQQRDIRNYINDLASTTNAVSIIPYFNKVEDFMDAACGNPDLSFDFYLSLLSPAYIDFSEIDTTTPEGQRLDCIYKKLTSSVEFRQLFEDTFGGDQDKINVKFRLQPNLLSVNGLPSDGNCTPTEVINGNYYTVITINSDILTGNLEKANILIAKTIIHEYLHAYLNLKYLDINQGTTLSFLSNLQLEELMYYYFTPATEHDFMFNQMIPVFQNILSEIISELLSTEDIADTNNNPITDANGIVIENFNFMNFYKYIAYEGLHNSQSYMNDIESNPIEKRKHIEYNNYAKNSSNDCQ